MNKDNKLERLKGLLKDMKRVVVAYSGGVDSTFLLHIANSTLGRDNVVAVTALSESYPSSEKRAAAETAKKLSARHVFITTRELKDRNFRKNPLNRCYYCKKELFRRLKTIARKNRYSFVLDGSTMDDLKDTRYGFFAAKEEKIQSPLLKAGLSKSEIRGLSKKIGLPTWNKPSLACLASRFSYNQKITRKRLKQVEKAENFITSLGIKELRVRCHENIARIEVGKDEIAKLLKQGLRGKIVKKLRLLGFTYVTLDLMGYRTGSMNEEILLK